MEIAPMAMMMPTLNIRALVASMQACDFEQIREPLTRRIQRAQSLVKAEITTPAGSETATRSARWYLMPSSQPVLIREVPMAPASVRRKFIWPAAEAISCSSTDPRTKR